MKNCSRCGEVMVDAACYDPEGTIPLMIEVDEDDRYWACMRCSLREEVAQ